MRRSLVTSFSDLYVYNLHGNSKKKEHAPSGLKDENVFDIQQGVAILLAVRRAGHVGNAKVHYADLWGSREKKYEELQAAWAKQIGLRCPFKAQIISFSPHQKSLMTTKIGLL